MYSCSGVFGILVRWYLVGLVESVDTRVAENAKRLWLGETPTASKHGEVGRGRNRDCATNSIQGSSTAESILARLKRDHPNLAQQVIDGDMSATRAAREVEPWNAGLFTICKKR